MRLTRTSNTAKASHGLGISRRQFMQRSALATGGIASAGFMGHSMVRSADAADKTPVLDSPVETKRTICSHCSVGCGVYAEVQEGIWTHQEPAFDHPINRGAHCAKGASLREHGHSTRRLKYPMKLVDGEWQRLSWDDAIEEIGNKVLELSETYSPDSIYWLVRPNSTTNKLLDAQVSPPWPVPTTPTTRRASVTRPPLPGSPTPGAMER